MEIDQEMPTAGEGWRKMQMIKNVLAEEEYSKLGYYSRYKDPRIPI
jgi:hypothetical protein